MRTTSTATHSLRSFRVTSWQLFALRAPHPFSDGTIRQGFPSCRIPTIRTAITSPCESQASLAFRGVSHTSTCARPVRNPLCVLCEQNARRRPHGALHTRSPGERIRSKFISSLPSVHLRDRLHPPWRFRTGFHSRRRARGGLMRSTARTSRSLPCKPGTVFEMATAATRPLFLVWCRLCRHSMHTLLRVTTHTPFHDTLTRRRGCAFPHTNRHFSFIPLSHTRGLSHTRSFTYTRVFTHALRAFQHARCTHTFNHTHRDNRTGESCHHRGFRGLHTPPSSSCTRS